MFSSKNVVVSTSMGVRDDRLGAMTSFIPFKFQLAIR